MTITTNYDSDMNNDDHNRNASVIYTCLLSSLIWYPTTSPSLVALSLATLSATAIAEMRLGCVQMMLHSDEPWVARAASRMNWGTWVVFPHLSEKQCRIINIKIGILKTNFNSQYFLISIDSKWSNTKFSKSLIIPFWGLYFIFIHAHLLQVSVVFFCTSGPT